VQARSVPARPERVMQQWAFACCLLVLASLSRGTRVEDSASGRLSSFSVSHAYGTQSRSRSDRKAEATTIEYGGLLMMSRAQLELLLQTDMEKAQGDKVRTLVKKLATATFEQTQCETSELTNKIVLAVTGANEKECSCRHRVTVTVPKCRRACKCEIKCLVLTLAEDCHKSQAGRIAKTLKHVEKRLFQAKAKVPAKRKAKGKLVVKGVEKLSMKYIRYCLLRDLLLELLREQGRDAHFRNQYEHLIGKVLRQKSVLNSQYRKVKSDKLVEVMLGFLEKESL